MNEFTINEYDELVQHMDKKPNITKKKDNGEVFTPLKLVDYILDELDEVYIKRYKTSIFSEPSLKWFDPAVGIGIFPIVLYKRLMTNLPIKNEEQKRKHILENMIYSAEVYNKNVNIYHKIFCGDKYKLNIYHGDSLNMNIKKEFGLCDQFDIVLGNPPYNSNGTKHKGNKNIYVYFSLNALKDWLKPNGYLVFLHPPVYRIPNHKIQHTQTNLNEIYTNKKICFIKMYSVDQISKLMYVMINVDFIIIQNTPNDSNKTKIIDINDKEYHINIKENEFIPNFGLNIMKKIKEKNIHGNMELIMNSQLHAQKTKGTTYKNIHGIRSKGIKIFLSDKKHTFYDSPKLIINGIGSYNYVFYDKKGEYGISQTPIAIICPSPSTLKFIQSPLFHYIANSTKIIGNNFNVKTCAFLPIIKQKIETNRDLYDYFNFTNNEINEINKFSIPEYKDCELSRYGKTSL